MIKNKIIGEITVKDMLEDLKEVSNSAKTYEEAGRFMTKRVLYYYNKLEE